ncbi:MAG TPA: hypothetical protein VN408_35820, partial [Actinoplanes sp.]|nr:hypothetical protein [Actinoplanes sp.]
IASLLREILPDEATEITLEGEADEGYSSASFTARQPDGTETGLDPEEHPEQVDEISALLIRLWEAETDPAWHEITVTVGRDGEPEVVYSEGEQLTETDEIIQNLAVVLREVLPDDAEKIVLDGELDEDWSSHDLTMYRADGTSYHIDWDDAPESLDDLADHLIDLFDSTTEDGDDPWYGITLTVRRDDTFEVNFSYEPLERPQD